MKVSERFMQHNADSPIVRSAWLDAKKKSPKGPPHTWAFMRVTLADGTVYDLPAAEVQEMNAANAPMRWAGITNTAL